MWIVIHFYVIFLSHSCYNSSFPPLEFLVIVSFKNVFAISLTLASFYTAPSFAFDITSEIKKIFIPQYEALQNMDSASPQIRTASSAVFRIEGGTGSFVKYDKETFIMTNNHVLGFKHCSKKGCFAKAIFNYQVGKEAVRKDLFVTPVAASDDVDVAFYRFKEVDPSGAFIDVVPSKYLSFSKTDQSIIGTDVFPVGHPRTSIKKFSQGKIVKYENNYMYVDALTLPGNSGSPILNNAGEIVGIHHSSAKKNDGITREGMLYIGRASSTGSILGVLNHGLANRNDLLKKFWDVDKVSTFKNAKRFSKIYIKSKTIPVTSSGEDFFDSLYKDCVKRVDFKTNHSARFSKSHDSCSVALSWINCSPKEEVEPSVKYVMASSLTDTHPDFGTDNAYCPSVKMRKKWAALFIKVGNKYEGFHGKDSLKWTADALGKLAKNENQAFKIVTKSVSKKFEKSNILSMTNILRLSKASKYVKSTTFKGKNIKNIVKNYKNFPGFEYELGKIAKSTTNLYKNKHLTIDEYKETMYSILNETSLSLNAKLATEKLAYENKIL
jgi:S1-C subfamily serine protease